MIFVVSSVTYALKGQRELARHNIRALLTKQAEVRSIKGCGYGLNVDNSHAAEAERILISAGLKLIGKVDAR